MHLRLLTGSSEAPHLTRGRNRYQLGTFVLAQQHFMSNHRQSSTRAQSETGSERQSFVAESEDGDAGRGESLGETTTQVGQLIAIVISGKVSPPSLLNRTFALAVRGPPPRHAIRGDRDDYHDYRQDG